jgi:hypothetical protein
LIDFQLKVLFAVLQALNSIIHLSQLQQQGIIIFLSKLDIDQTIDCYLLEEEELLHEAHQQRPISGQLH